MYGTSPMEQFDKLSLGSLLAMTPEEAAGYKTRQRGYDTLMDKYNQQVINEANPALIENQRLQNLQQGLTNQQLEALMPTHKASGAAAQALLDTTDYYKTQAQNAMLGQQVTGEEQQQKLTGLKAQAPYTAQIAGDTAQQNAQIARAGSMAALLLSPEIQKATEPEAVEWVMSRMPNQADKILPLIQKHGVTKAAKMFAKQLNDMYKLNPDYVKAYMQAEHSLQAAQVRQPTERDSASFIAAYIKDHPGTTELQARMAYEKMKNPPTTTSYRTADGVTMGEQTKTPIYGDSATGGGARGGSSVDASKNSPVGKIITGSNGKQYRVIGVNQNGTYRVEVIK